MVLRPCSARSSRAALAALAVLVGSGARGHDAADLQDVLRAGIVCSRLAHGRLLARTELYFGLSRPGGAVSPEEFQSFVDLEVTPRFPDGSTVVEGRGQFRGGSGVTEREDSRVLILLYALDRSSNARIEEIREAYKGMFDQESVLRADELSCVSF
jgi:hypothetical protein